MTRDSRREIEQGIEDLEPGGGGSVEQAYAALVKAACGGDLTPDERTAIGEHRDVLVPEAGGGVES